MISYVVRIDFEDAAVRDDTLQWLRDRHIADVLAAGALAAELVVLDDVLAIEIRYRFSTREAFASYERDHAPRLRAEGLTFFANRPVRFTRTTGEIDA